MKNRTGEKYLTTEGYTIEIVKYLDCENCTIQFEDGTNIENRGYRHIQNGHIKNPLHKSVLEVGFRGLGNYSKTTHPKIYQTWQNMLARCYNDKYQEKFLTYIGCSVIDYWHNFQVFAKWYENNYVEDWQLDKDILIKGNKIYSPETCVFVPQEVNKLFVKSNAIRGEYPIGVYKVGDKFIARLNINGKHTHIGTFNTPQEAFKAFKTAKENQIKCVANEWKDKITKQTYQALINYTVEITD